jgi:hypothetical protein
MNSQRSFASSSIDPELLPRPGTRWCEYEKRALEIRRLVGLRPGQSTDRPFDPFHLAELLGFQIAYLSDLPQLSPEVQQQLSNPRLWSGAALQLPHQPSPLILLNHHQSPRRLRATLMEEISHLLLGHPPSRLTPLGLHGRTFARDIEEEAYAIGAATLVPFFALRHLLTTSPQPPSVASLGDYFFVSRALVLYRVKVLHLSAFLPLT